MSLESEVEFCFKVLPLLEASSNSTVFSPASILNALAMIYSGANGNTAKQIAEIIGGKNEKQILQYYSKFVKRHRTTDDKKNKLKTSKKMPEEVQRDDQISRKKFYDPENDPNAKVTVNIATGFFVAKNASIVPSFEALIKDSFDGQIKSIDFDKTQKAVEEINTFVSDKTDKNITEIISSEDLYRETSLILVNAIHFIGAWKVPFDDKRVDAKFYSNPPRQIPMMTNTVPPSPNDGWNYQENENWQALGIPYKNSRHWLFIVLPKKKDGLLNLINNFNYSMFKQCTKRNTPNVIIYVDMPIMEIATTIDLVEKLRNLGITDAFSSRCDLCRMLEGSNKIEAAIHKAIIKVDEKGTVASAANIFRITPRSSANIQFYATHPFLYFITSTDSSKLLIPKDILFMGTFC